MSVRPSVCPTQVGSVPKWLNKITQTMPYNSYGILVSDAKNLRDIVTASPPMGRQIEGRFKLAIFDQRLAMSLKPFRIGT